MSLRQKERLAAVHTCPVSTLTSAYSMKKRMWKWL